MELNAKGRHLPFMTAVVRLRDRFGISLSDDEFIEPAYYIWRSIGNIATEEKVAEVIISEDLVVTLPQDCEFVNTLVSTAFQDHRYNEGSFGDYYFNPKGRNGEVRPDPAMTSIEANARASIKTLPGERVDYKTYDGYLKVSSPVMMGCSAMLVYASILKDEDGLPMLNDLEVEAIAITMALREAEKALFRKDNGADKIVAYLAPLSEKALCAAKADEIISDDGLDEFLDIKTSWGRKVHASRFNYRT